MLDFLAKAPRLARHPLLGRLATTLPWGFSGAAIHRTGLEAFHREDYALALEIFEQAGLAYRREVEVQSLARLRVHEMMARVRKGRPNAAPGTLPLDVRGSLILETERRLARLHTIESLAPPFTVVDARELLATWYAEAESPNSLALVGGA